MTATRERLPFRRPCVNYELRLQRADGWLTLFVSLGRYPDGRLAEVFVDALKEGHEMRTAYHGWARLASKALQYGVPLDALSLPPAGPDEAAWVHCEAAPGVHGRRVASVYEAVWWLLKAESEVKE